MKNTFLYTGALMLLLNSIVGLILSFYDVFNWVVNDIVIVFNIGALLYLSVSKIKDGFKFGMSFLILFLFLAQFVIGLFLDNSLNDNWLLILMLVAGIINIGLLLVVRSLSKFA